MTADDLEALKKTVQAKASWSLNDYYGIDYNFLSFIEATRPTRIVSPFRQNKHYIFYQYGDEAFNRITRPLNTKLFIESPESFKEKFERFMAFLADLRLHQDAMINSTSSLPYLEAREIDKVVYTIQQTIGCIGDTFENPNQTRKRIGQLFETLIKLLI